MRARLVSSDVYSLQKRVLLFCLKEARLKGESVTNHDVHQFMTSMMAKTKNPLTGEWVSLFNGSEAQVGRYVNETLGAVTVKRRMCKAADHDSPRAVATRSAYCNARLDQDQFSHHVPVFDVIDDAISEGRGQMRMQADALAAARVASSEANAGIAAAAAASGPASLTEVWWGPEDADVMDESNPWPGDYIQSETRKALKAVGCDSVVLLKPLNSSWEVITPPAPKHVSGPRFPQSKFSNASAQRARSGGFTRSSLM